MSCSSWCSETKPTRLSSYTANSEVQGSSPDQRWDDEYHSCQGSRLTSGSFWLRDEALLSAVPPGWWGPASLRLFRKPAFSFILSTFSYYVFFSHLSACLPSDTTARVSTHTGF